MLQPPALLQLRGDLGEGGAEMVRAGLVQPLAQGRVAGGPVDAVQIAQILRLRGVLPVPHRPAGPQQGGEFEPEHRQTAHQAVGGGEAAGADRIGHVLKHTADSGKEAGQLQMPTQGGFRHDATARFLFCGILAESPGKGNRPRNPLRKINCRSLDNQCKINRLQNLRDLLPANAVWAAP